MWLEIFIGATIGQLFGRFTTLPVVVGSIEGVVLKKMMFLFSNLLWNTIMFLHVPVQQS